MKLKLNRRMTVSAIVGWSIIFFVMAIMNMFAFDLADKVKARQERCFAYPEYYLMGLEQIWIQEEKDYHRVMVRIRKAKPESYQQLTLIFGKKQFIDFRKQVLELEVSKDEKKN